MRDTIDMAREWLSKAYRDEDVGGVPKFTKYNMEVAFAAGAAAEREACAKVCEDNSASYSERASRPEKVRDINPEVARVAVQTCGHVAAAIRARGNT
jgi:hypothetical protein